MAARAAFDHANPPSLLSLQVWFQNKRSKERRLKQLTSMGRGPFYGGSRKMRGFPMNLSPGGLDDGPPGFPYFATADGKFEFGYGGPPPFHHDFFPPHHPHHGPPQQGLPFPQGEWRHHHRRRDEAMRRTPAGRDEILKRRCGARIVT